MARWDMNEILVQLLKMDPDLENADYGVQYARCQEIYNKLNDYTDYVLEELVDAETFEKKWFWRRKS